MIVKEENSFEKHSGVTDGWVVIGSKSDPPAAPHGAARLRLEKNSNKRVRLETDYDRSMHSNTERYE